MSKKILIVEDEESLRNILRDKLSKNGFIVLEARNGEEGLTVALKEHPDLILLDVIMPEMDGITMLKKLREDDWGDEVTVIMLTNLIDTEKISGSIKHGPAEYFLKADLKIEDLVVKINKWLKI